MLLLNIYIFRKLSDRALLICELADLIGCDTDLTGGTKSKNIETCRKPVCSSLSRAIDLHLSP